MARNLKYSDESVRLAVEASTSMSDVVRRLGIKMSGGSHFHMKKRVDRMGLDTSHFRNSTGGRTFAPKRSASQILVVRPDDVREKSNVLRRALLEIGRPELCEGCGIGPEWNGEPLTLEIDHVDGNSADNRPENVRFMCPNCHAQCATTNMPWKYRTA